jgi:hypothetical protein
MNPGSHHQKDLPPRPAAQRQIRLQIYLPLIFGSLVIVGLSLVLLLEDRSPGVIADIAVICLALPILLLGVLTMVLLGLGVFAADKVIRKLPAPFRKAHQFLGRLEGTAKQVGDMAAKPMISSLSAWAGVKAIFQSVASIFRSDEENLYE